MTADALLSLSAIEQAVYDPPRLGHEYDEDVYLMTMRGNKLFITCQHCHGHIGKQDLGKPCPARPVPGPDWQACLIAADICEDMSDMAQAAWWRWLHVKRKVPTINRDVWDWWKPDAPSSLPDHARIEMSLYRRLSFRRFDQGRYDTRRAAYLDLARAVCEQWRQEHEMRKELTV